MIEYFKNLTEWIVAIIVPLIGILVIIYVQRLNAFRSASNKFTEIFLNELKDIYPIPVNWPNDIHIFLESRFTTLQAAVEEFRKSLPCYKRKSFENAWFRFFCSTGREVDKNCQSYLHYMNFSGQPDGKETFKHNVDQLLKFAKKTIALRRIANTAVLFRQPLTQDMCQVWHRASRVQGPTPGFRGAEG